MSTNLPAPAGFSASNLVFQDNFSGSSLNSAYWNNYMSSGSSSIWDSNGNGGSGVGAQYDSEYFMPSQDSVNNGLTLTAIQQSVTGADYVNGAVSPATFPVTSGVVDTNGKVQLDGGYIQISMKAPSGDGAWPGLWLLPANGSNDTSPTEIDIQEGGFTSGSANPNDTFAYHLHTSVGTFGGVVDTGIDLTASFNTYAINWIPGQSITWYLNGKQIAEITSAQAPIPNEPMELIMDQQVGNSAASSWRTSLDSSTPQSMAMQVADVQIYQASGDAITGSNVTAGGGATPTTPAAVAPTVAITSAGGAMTQAAQTIAGTVDVADAGSTVKLLDGTTQVATATVGATGAWSANVTLNQGANVLTATDTNATGTGKSSAITDTLTASAPTPPTSSTLTLAIADSTLHVSAGGGTVDLGIKESAPSSATAASITITGLPRYETITDGLGDTFSGGRHGIKISEAQVNSGLTLTSNYQGTSDPTATLQITANDTVAGVASHSAAQTLTVIDPPATSTAASTTTTGQLALLNQYIAGGFDHHSGGAPLMSNVAASFAHDDSFLTSSRHA